MGARQDLLKALSCEVSGLKRRGARKVALGGGGHPQERFLDSGKGEGEVTLGGSWWGSFICFLHKYQFTYGDVTCAYILLVGESRVKEKGGGLEDSGTRKQSFPLFQLHSTSLWSRWSFLLFLLHSQSLPTQHSDLFVVMGAGTQIWLPPAVKGASS